MRQNSRCSLSGGGGWRTSATPLTRTIRDSFERFLSRSRNGFQGDRSVRVLLRLTCCG